MEENNSIKPVGTSSPYVLSTLAPVSGVLSDSQAQVMFASRQSNVDPPTFAHMSNVPSNSGQVAPQQGPSTFEYPGVLQTSSAYSSFQLQSPPRCVRVAEPSFASPIFHVPLAMPAQNVSFISPPHSTSASFTALEPVTPSRLYQSPRAICGQQGKATPMSTERNSAGAMGSGQSGQSFKSPSHPFRIRAPDGTEFQPIIKKTGTGKISITYPMNMLGNMMPGQISADKLTQTIATPRDSFTQFLSFPSLSDDVKLKSPQSSVQGAQIKATPERQAGATVGFKSPRIQHEPTTPAKTKTTEENEEEEEERESVQTITKALNIECDVYKETKKRARQEEGVPKARMRNKLPKEVQGLMGEANLCFARGEHDDAIKMCMEIVRLAPYCPDPFETLAMIYEERGEKVKSLQYSLLAAHLQPADVETWVRLAETCEEVGFLLQAVHCYNKASKLNPTDYKLCWAAAVLQQQLGNLKQALILFKSVVNLLPETEVIQCMALARDIARTCHANNETALAMEVMEEVATKHLDHVKFEDMNVMCELSLSAKKYKKVLDILVKHCNLNVLYECGEESDENKQPASITVPEQMPIDLQCKCILASIHLGCFEQVKQMFEDLCAMNPVDVGDLQFDIAEVLIEVGEYRRALYVLDILVSSAEYSLAAVWLEKAKCHRFLEEYIAERDALRDVVRLAPGHIEAYLSLCKVLTKLGKHKEAIEVVEEAEAYEIQGEEQMLLNYQRFLTYLDWAPLSKKRHEKLCKAADCALLMLAKKMEAAFIPAKTILVKRNRHSGKAYMGDLKLSRRTGRHYYKYQNKKSLSAKGTESALSHDQWWELNKTTIDLLLETKRYAHGIILADASLFCAPWYNCTEKRIVLERIAVTLCIIGGNYSLAYTYIKTWLLQSTKSNQLWNLFNQITRRSQDQRHHRFCLRSLIKEPESTALAVLTGHNSLATGTYKHSLGEYMRAHKKIPTEPMFMLLLGVIYTHIASQRFTSHKNSLVVQSLAFLNLYSKHRKCDQESYYNIGRALQQLGLVHFAIHWYQRALETPPVVHPELENDVLDLRCEIAYNLALIYRKSGNLAMANQLIEKHCVI